ncbi:MAG: hypothetical protein KFB96_06935 [Thiocapsa sp.]|uniref:hypothetical protein n=1 Tax=Thiocapsa sp. TaxID=2024551 RepID=UPI001BCD43A1|nr:hypothetical protein [Thiocapsa sp.]QVL50187.1 MAG: hypothetical protein KFB96_06935 [Thiocapsa sp.]
MKIASRKPSGQPCGPALTASPTGLLEGQGVHSSRSLRRVAAASNDPDNREHVGARYFSEHPEDYRIIGFGLPAHLQERRWRVTVDEAADYQLMASLYQALWQGQPIAIEQAVRWLEANPEAAALNQRVQHSIINQELAAKRAAREPQVQARVLWKREGPE